MQRVIVVLGLALAAAAAAADTPVLITLTDGRVLDVVVLDYAAGIFTVKDESTNAITRVPAQNVTRMKFQQTQLVEAPRMLNARTIQRAVQERRYMPVLRSFEILAATGQQERVEQIEAELAQAAAAPSATPEQKRDATLGRVLALVSLRQPNGSHRDAAKKLLASLPRDEVVTAFERELLGPMRAPPRDLPPADQPLRPRRGETRER